MNRIQLFYEWLLIEPNPIHFAMGLASKTLFYCGKSPHASLHSEYVRDGSESVDDCCHSYGYWCSNWWGHHLLLVYEVLRGSYNKLWTTTEVCDLIALQLAKHDRNQCVLVAAFMSVWLYDHVSAVVTSITTQCMYQQQLQSTGHRNNTMTVHSLRAWWSDLL